MIIYVWPDASWMDSTEYDDNLDAWRGDDYIHVHVDDNVEDIDQWVHDNASPSW